MERMFPESKEFIYEKLFVCKDSKAPYDRYWNKNSNKWTGLLNASKFTEKEVKEFIQLPENGIIISFNKVVGIE